MTSDQYKVDRILFDIDKNSKSNKWIFHNENWIRVKKRWEHRRILAEGQQLKVSDNYQEPTNEIIFEHDGSIRFEGKTECNDEWFYLFLDPNKYGWIDYYFKFPIRRDSYFREFQIGFRYQDFYNRYRYRLENDCIYFEKVINGKFYYEFGSAPFHMKLGVWYNVEIFIYKNNFKFYVNGSLILNDFDFYENFPSGSIAIILWENDGKTDILASIGPIQVYKLVPAGQTDSN